MYRQQLCYENGVPVDESCRKYFIPHSTIKLQWKEAESITRIYKTYWNGKDKSINEEEYKILEPLKNAIDAEIMKKGKIFIKLAGQSPKDVAFFKNNKFTTEELQKRLKRVAPDDYNGQLLAFIKAVNASLCITSGEKAIEYITTSHRIFDSLKKELRQCLSNSFKSQIETEHHEEFEYEMPNGSNSNPSDSYLQITMREYVEINPESEFRCFVKNRQLVGISQYESGLYCKSLQNPEKQQEIKAKLTSFYERISHLFYDNDFIMDVVIVGDRIYIVEISPYSENSSACLFEWGDNVLSGNSALVFRCRTEPLEDPLSAIQSRFWLQFIKSEVENRSKNGNLWLPPSKVLPITIPIIFTLFFAFQYRRSIFPWYGNNFY